MNKFISRRAAINELYNIPVYFTSADGSIKYVNVLAGITRLAILPATQPEYEPVKVEDFAKIMSENTVYSFMTWYGKALELMERYGFVICKKTI